MAAGRLLDWIQTCTVTNRAIVEVLSHELDVIDSFIVHVLVCNLQTLMPLCRGNWRSPSQ